MKLSLRDSANVRAAEYDQRTGTLRVTFFGREGKPDRAYDYSGVPEEAVTNFQKDVSPGAFVKSVLRGYKSVKVEEKE